MNINIPKKLHKDGKEREHEVRIHSAIGFCSIIINAFLYAVFTSVFLFFKRLLHNKRLLFPSKIFMIGINLFIFSY